MATTLDLSDFTDLPDETLLQDDPYGEAPDSGRTGVLRGYGRVSTKDQNLARQTKRLKAAHCINPLYLDKQSGKNADRPELIKVLNDLEPGDTLIVTSLDRLGRNLDDLIQLMKAINQRGAGFRSLSEAIDTTTPVGRLIFHIFGAIAQFVREIIHESSAEGLALAKARGVKLGRPTRMTPEKIAYALQLMEDPQQSITSMARLLGVSRTTLYAAVPELRGERKPGRPKALPPRQDGDVELVLADQVEGSVSGQLGVPLDDGPA